MRGNSSPGSSRAARTAGDQSRGWRSSNPVAPASVGSVPATPVRRRGRESLGNVARRPRPYPAASGPRARSNVGGGDPALVNQTGLEARGAGVEAQVVATLHARSGNTMWHLDVAS